MIRQIAIQQVLKFNKYFLRRYRSFYVNRNIHYDSYILRGRTKKNVSDSPSRITRQLITYMSVTLIFSKYRIRYVRRGTRPRKK